MSEFYKTIMVAVDDSNQAKLAFEKAVRLAKQLNSKLIIAHVIEEIYFQSARGEVVDMSPDEDLRPHIDKRLKEYEKRAYAAGLKDSNLIIKKGKPKVVLSSSLIEENQVDLIVMGATGLSAIDRLLLGSTSEFVLRRAACDVLIVR